MLTEESLNRIANGVAEQEERRIAEQQWFAAESVKWAADEQRLISEGKHPRFKVIHDPLGLFSHQAA